ncbi:MAG TPA: PadR family transcriptional regulator [Candidatus Aminicenantes bacterium]|nr:PadR family transcriptional regulator [Candidatus Aminicenantes bacterium]
MGKYMAEDIDNKATQLRKGILELAVMSALHDGAHYGYSLVRCLTAAGAVEIKEGTVYPILARLSREGLVIAHWVESSQGPPRKYYELTAAGRQTCEALQAEFRRLVRLVKDAARPAAAPAGAPEEKKIAIGRKQHE